MFFNITSISEINLTATTIFVVFTFLLGLIFAKKRVEYLLLLVVLFFSSITEISAYLNLKQNESIVAVYNFNIIAFQLLWLFIVIYLLNKSKNEFWLAIIFIIFCLLNLFFIEQQDLNFLTFTVGSFIYLAYFFWHNYIRLKSERLRHFSSNTFLLISAPLPLLFALSFIFAFRESDMRNLQILDRSFYNILQNGGNFIYYSLLITYIIKSRNEGKTQLTND